MAGANAVAKERLAETTGAGAFESRSFRLYQSARLLVILGAEAQSIAVAWQVYQMTQSALSLGYTGLALFLPGLIFVLPAGHVADRYDKRHVILACYALQAICTVVLLWISLRHLAGGAHSVAPIYVVLFLIGLGRCFSGPAASALVPLLVPKESFVNAVTWGATVFQVANATGPMVGGLLFTASAAWLGRWRGAPLVYAFTLAMLLGFLALVGSIRVRAGGGEKKAFKASTVLAGLKYVAETKLLLGAISLDLFAVLLGGAVALLPIFAHDVLHAGAEGLGLLRAMPSLGALAVSLWLVIHPIRHRAGRLMLICVAVFGAATVLFGLSRTMWLSMAALVLVGASDMVSVVIRSSVLQLATPPEMRGRVSAVNWLFIGASNEFGEFESGLTAHWWGAVRAVLVGGMGSLIVTALCAGAFPALRRADQLTAESLRAAEVELAEAEPID